MTLKKQMKRHLGKKATRRIYSAMPWVGGVVALAAGTYLQRRGALPSASDAFSQFRHNTSSAHDRDEDLVGSR